MAWPIITDEMKKEASRVLTEEKLVLGESVFKFEEEFADFIGVDHAVSTSSGTDALFLIMKAMGIHQEVITTPMSFVATTNAVLSAGGKPVFADINPNTGNISTDLIEDLISDATETLLPVHLHGFPADMDPILDYAEDHDLTIIEDACQAHGAEYKGKKTGSMGTASAFSFYSTKNMTVGGDGGMVTTNDDQIANSIKKMRNGGRVLGEKYIHDSLGYTHRLDTVSAAIGRLQLKHLPDWNARRREIADRYITALKDIEEINIPRPLDKSTPVYHLFPIMVDNRDKFVQQMKANGIEVGKNYPVAIPDQPYYQPMENKGSWSHARTWGEHVACLPMHLDLSDDDVKYVIDMIHELYL